MKLFIAVIVVLLASMHADAASCYASGDPHFGTFDGCYHDFQGNGVFSAVKNPVLEVQYLARPCNPPHPVTCVNALYISVQRPDYNINSSVVTFFVAGSQSTYYAIIDGVRYTWAQLSSPIALKNGLGSVSREGGYMAVSAIRGAWKVRAAQYQMIIDLPSNMDFLGSTYGVCGLFNGDRFDDFTDANKTLVESPVKPNGNRISTAGVNRWAATFFAPPFALSGHSTLLADHRFFAEHNFELLETPNIPNSSVQAELDKLIFSDVASYNAAKDNCQKLSPSADPIAIENCVYDAAVLKDFALAASNQEASNNAGAQSSSSSGLNGGQIAGIVLGCVAFVSLVTALVVYVRLHKLRNEYSRALIVRSQPQGTAANTNALADNL